MAEDVYEEFRIKVREWLIKNTPESLRRRELLSPVVGGGVEEKINELKAWHKKVYEAGFIGIWWPKEYGGYEDDPVKEIIVYEEFMKFGAPLGNPASILGLTVVGPILLIAGTEEQKKKYLKRILTGEDIWCEGLSEPAAGSDLASIQTEAIDKGDHFIIRGQKIWSSYAHLADYMLLLARTGRPEDRYKNLTLMIVDMKSPGITVKPIKQITGLSEFNIEYFDDVKVPKENVIGKVNEGWKLVVQALNFERLLLMPPTIISAEIAAKEVIRSKVIKNIEQIEDEILDILAVKILYERVFDLLKRKIIPGPEVASVKIIATDAAQKLYRKAVEEGDYSILFRESNLFGLTFGLLSSFVGTIGGGTNEVLRNLIGEHVLKLPK
jgi:alkylation response protein AidB-like acyl-CoA dehydrogenase